MPFARNAGHLDIPMKLELEDAVQPMHRIAGLKSGGEVDLSMLQRWSSGGVAGYALRVLVQGCETVGQADGKGGVSCGECSYPGHSNSCSVDGEFSCRGYLVNWIEARRYSHEAEE